MWKETRCHLHRCVALTENYIYTPVYVCSITCVEQRVAFTRTRVRVRYYKLSCSRDVVLTVYIILLCVHMYAANNEFTNIDRYETHICLRSRRLLMFSYMHTVVHEKSQVCMCECSVSAYGSTMLGSECEYYKISKKDNCCDCKET